MKPKLAYGNKKVVKEAFERKHGGACVAGRLDKRASGGRANATASPMSPGVAKHPYSSAK